MKCAECQQDNPAEARFCLRCGAALSTRCGTCGTELPGGARFCFSCGQPVAGSPASTRFRSPHSYTPTHLAEKILTSRAALEGERKQVTVLFADMKGSMELLADRDPEEARKVLDPVLEVMMEAVHRYEGTVNQVMGDGIMALFGAPIAHEEHAVRACYAALRMQDTVGRLDQETMRSHGVPVQIRVGLNSGEVVVRSIGSDLHMDYTAVGQTTHLAARMEQLARPGAILMTAATLGLVEGYVDVKPLGLVPVRGLAEPVDVYEVTGTGPVRRRLQALARRALSRFVGRETELEHLRRALERAGEGHGQVVAVVGEPGVGKSRLFYEFTRSHRTQGWLVLESGSVSYGRATPYLPVLDLLRAYFKIDERDDQRTIREKVTGKLFSLDRALEPSLPAFLALLDLPVEDAEWQALDPPRRRRRTLDALKGLLLRESQSQPLVLVVEDLHWIDSETQAFLDNLVEGLPTARVLLLVNYRPEYQHGWGGKSYYTQLRIDPLPPQSSEDLLEALLGPDPALAPLKRLLIERTEGNPFFLEESVRALLETGALVGERGACRLTRPVERLQVPPTAQAILAARIDRLAPDRKRLLQAAAVVGKDVPFSLLETVTAETGDELRAALAELQAQEFLYEARLFPDLEYTFKHALTHEVTYGSLLHERRCALHARLVEAIETLYADRLTEQVERLAHHAVRGELGEKAVAYLRQAGTKAFARSANADAVAYLRQGLELVRTWPPGTHRDREELALQLALGPVLQMTRGFGAPEVGESYSRARELAEQVGEPAQRFQALWGLWLLYTMRARLQTARQLATELLAIAEGVGDRALVLEGHHALWPILLWLGEHTTARRHLEQGIALYDKAQHRGHAFLYGGHDPGVCCRMFLSLALWVLGHPERGLESSIASLRLAEELAHPASLAIALAWASFFHDLRRDVDSKEQCARALIAVSTEHGLPQWLAVGNIVAGSIRAELGEGEATISHIRHGIEAYRATGAQLFGSYFLSLLARAYAKNGQPDEGLGVIDEALAIVGATGERLWAPELHRLRGELLLARSPGDVVEAEACFRRAVEIAREQEARSWELRAATSLARLVAAAGKRDGAHRLLAEIYGWFTEGFDTADLRDAKTLL